jgi:hypothetical protein
MFSLARRANFSLESVVCGGSNAPSAIQAKAPVAEAVGFPRDASSVPYNFCSRRSQLPIAAIPAEQLLELRDVAGEKVKEKDFLLPVHDPLIRDHIPVLAPQ